MSYWIWYAPYIVLILSRPLVWLVSAVFYCVDHFKLVESSPIGAKLLFVFNLSSWQVAHTGGRTCGLQKPE